MGMFTGFRTFLLRGNVIDLAVAVVIGGAFSALINAVTNNLLKPLINVFLGGGVEAGSFTVQEQTFDYASVINAAITFLITAAVVYFLVVVPMRRVLRLMERDQAAVAAPAPAPDVVLLTEIRDLLRQQGSGGRDRV